MKIPGEINIVFPANVLCDKCGSSTRSEIGNLEYASLSAHWGYGTRKDMEKHETHFCEDCYDWLLEILKAHGLTPTITEQL